MNSLWSNIQLRIHRRHTLSIVSGILIGTSFIPFPPWASIFGFLPLWLVWKTETSWKKVFLAGWITQFVLTFIGFNWVAHTAHEFGRLPWPIAIGALIAFCSFANLYVPLAGLGWWLTKQKLKPGPFLSVLILVAFTSFFEMWVPTIFPWNYGYTFFWSGLPIAQTAELFGFQGISAIIIGINGLLFLALQAKDNKNHRRSFAGAAIGLFLVLNAVGVYLKARLPEPDQKAKVAIIQANIGNMEKIYAQATSRFREEILGRYINLTRLAHEKATFDFAVWPETAFPEDLGNTLNPHPIQFQLKNFLQQNKIRLVTGAYGEDAKERITNSVYFLDSSGAQAAERYSKTHLLAFGEYFPGANIFPWFRKLIPNIGDFGRGTGPSMRVYGETKLGAQICYESLYPYFSRDLARQGTQIIVNVTNDSWFGTHMEPFQHLYMTLARAVENRVPIVRATNTGISTVVQASGEVGDRSPQNESWFGFYEVGYYSQPQITLFTRFPYLVFYLLGFSLIASIVFHVLKRRA